MTSPWSIHAEHADAVAHVRRATDQYPEGQPGFVVLSMSAELLNKITDCWCPKHTPSLLWNNPGDAIDWPLDFSPQRTAKDPVG